VKRDKKHIIIFRFSALGDVAIAAPVVRAAALSNPQHKFTMVSRPAMEPLFSGIPNLLFWPADFKGRHKGFKGLFRIWLSLLKQKPTHIADIHNVTRTWVLRTLFFFSFIPVNYLKKGRGEKRRLTAKNNKELKQLTPVYERYAAVLKQTGITLPVDFSKFCSVISPKFCSENFSKFCSEKKLSPGTTSKPNTNLTNTNLTNTTLRNTTLRNTSLIKIGIAPFAKHRAKAWPLEKMEQVIDSLTKNPKIRIYLFGGGREETIRLLALQQKYSCVESVAGRFGLSEELEIMKDLDLFISMDSANMHLASLVSTPVISVWGATHPYAGFYGLGQPAEYAVQTSLECRPCSVYGNKKCYRGDYACLNEIEPSDLLQKVEDYLKRMI
ncbi:MAG: glycosyltransferase family 9 protein, partial [Bacteroidales bacterium]|nr:glycosyltransferase family 9 protein [Bacteroidales bacterium]